MIKYFSMIKYSISVLLLAFICSCNTPEDNSIITDEIQLKEQTSIMMRESESCPDEDSQEDELSPNHPPEPDPNWRLNLHRDFRDNFLLKVSKYKKYVEYYYSFSEEVNYSDFEFSTKLKIWEHVLSLDNPLLNILDDNYKGVIIDEQLEQDILSITNDLKELTRNKYMFDEFEIDLRDAVNKTKQELID